jgi:hypothetical protein
MPRMPEELITYLEEGVLAKWELEEWTPEYGFEDDDEYPRG